jgi:hypothetical protein
MSTIKANNYEAATSGNTLIFNTGGSEMMRIVPSSATLKGVGVGLAGNALALNSNGTTVHIHEPTANRASILHCTSAFQGLGNAKGFICGLWNNNDVYCFTYDPVSMQFGTSGAIRMTVTSDGNVGIGTQTPAVALDVVGQARSSTSTTSASNDKTLTTKDYVDTQVEWYNKAWTSTNPPIGTIIIASVQYVFNSNVQNSGSNAIGAITATTTSVSVSNFRYVAGATPAGHTAVSGTWKVVCYMDDDGGGQDHAWVMLVRIS